MKLIICACSILFGWTAVWGAPSLFEGTFKGNDSLIRINGTGPGSYAGEIVVTGQPLRFTAQEKDGALVGAFPLEDENVEFRMTLKGSKLTLTIEDESSQFIRQETTSKKSGPAPGPEKPALRSKAAERAASLKVNGVVIDETALAKFEKEHRLKIPRGDYWYDRVSGAWGMAGGPTLGFTAAGMSLGGPLRKEASGGDTGVFINNRELPFQDVVGLQQLNVPVQRGRWWVDNRGDFGVEGNPAMVGNIFQFGQGKGGAYQRPTAGGYIGGDGQTSYFFDPKSGSSVMVGN